MLDHRGTIGKLCLRSAEEHMEESGSNHKEQVGNMPFMRDGILFPRKLDKDERVRAPFLLTQSVCA